MWGILKKTTFFYESDKNALFGKKCEFVVFLTL
jgi:hypothetical protein